MGPQTVAEYEVVMARPTAGLVFDPQSHRIDLLGAARLLGAGVYVVGVYAGAGLLPAVRLFQGEL